MKTDISDFESDEICNVVWIYLPSGRMTISLVEIILKHREFGQLSAMHFTFFHKIRASLALVEVIGIFGIDSKMTGQQVPSRDDRKGTLPLTESTVQIKCCELQGCIS